MNLVGSLVYLDDVRRCCCCCVAGDCGIDPTTDNDRGGNGSVVGLGVM